MNLFDLGAEPFDAAVCIYTFCKVCNLVADNALYGVFIDVGALCYGDERLAAVVRVMTWIKGRPPESPTERQAIARLYYSGQIAIVDRCIDELDPTLAPFILKGVTEGIGFEKLQAQGCPCCREMYYEYYRYFFWLLSKERQ